MEIRLSRIGLLNGLIPMQRVTKRRTTTPALSCLLLRGVGGYLEITATDLEVSLTSACEGELREEGAIAIQAKKLLEIIRASEGKEVTLRIDAEGVLTILVGKSRFKVRGLPAEDFPTLPTLGDEESVQLPFKTFRGMIDKVFYAISSRQSQFQLSGALLEQQEGSLALVATDGHRLALVESEVEGMTEAEGVLVPRKALRELMRFKSELGLEIRRSAHHLSFTLGKRQLTCRILEGTFPDYERVISKDNDKHVVLDRKLLADVVRRVSLLAGNRLRVIKMELRPGQMVFSATNPDLGEATEEVPCDYEGPETALGVNPDYIGQFLSSISDTDQVRLELKDENSRCVAYPVDGEDRRHVCVIMPIRL